MRSDHESITSTIAFYNNKLDTLLQNASERIGGTYATASRTGIVRICYAARDMMRTQGIEINSETVFMDIGAGQGRLCWYGANVLGCRSIAVEIDTHRSMLAAQTARTILENKARRVPVANSRVAFHCMDATKVSDWSEVQIFFLWDAAFSDTVVLGMHQNIGKLLYW